MPIITSIKPQKNKKRVNIHLDGKFGFGLDLETFIKLNLSVGKRLSDEAIKKIVREAEFQKVYDKILRFAILRPRSEKEFEDWLKRHKVHKSLHDELFKRLKRLEFLDDRKFATWWVEQRLQFKFKSKRELVQELRLKGVAKDIIEDVLSDAQIDEEKAARGILEKKAYRWKNLEGFEKRKKMAEFLGRKGFGWDVINEVIKD